MVYKKLAVFILITAIFVSSAYSARASDWFYATKEFGLDLASRAIASTMIRILSNQLIQKIQGGGEGGGPAFVQNWRNFQTDSQYRGEDVFRSVLAGTKMCDYFDKDIKNLFGVKSTQIKTPLGQNLRVDNFDPFNLRSGCTMPSNFNIQNYQKDFAGNGGWSAFSRMLEPQNNYYGVLFGSLDEAARQRSLEAQAAIQEAQAGSGYTSIRGGCQDQFGSEFVGPTQPSQARCTFMGKVFTPADLLGKTAALSIDKDLEGIVNSDELTETIIAVGNAVVGRLINLAGSAGSDETTEILANDESLRNEYCSAKFPSQEALDKYGKTPGFESSYDRAKVKKSGFKSPCEKVRDQNGTDNPYPYQRCIIACFKAVGVIPENVIVPTPPVIPPDETLQSICTQLGQNEQDFMLPLLNGGTSPQDVVNQTNQQFNLTTGNQAVYYPDNNTIGLPEFYLAGPTLERPVSPSTGLPWDVVIRCDSSGGGPTPSEEPTPTETILP